MRWCRPLGIVSYSAALRLIAVHVFPARPHWMFSRRLVEEAESSLHDPTIGELVRACGLRLVHTGMHLQQATEPWHPQLNGRCADSAT